jgi:hypothetical protein
VAKRFEYRVCLIQSARITFVNGQWQGRVAPPGQESAALESCPMEWEYLTIAGSDGWELVAALAASRNDPSAHTLYLRRER